MEQSLLWRLFNASVYQWIGLIIALGVLAGVVVWIRSLFREDEDTTADAHLMMVQFSELHRQGHLSDDEYRSIKGRLVTEIRDHTLGRSGGSESPAPGEAETPGDSQTLLDSDPSKSDATDDDRAEDGSIETPPE